MLAHAIPDVTQIFVATGFRGLATRASIKIVNGVLEEGVLVADDLLKRGAVHHRAGYVLRLAPRDIVEVIIFERAVEIVGVPETRVRSGVSLPIPIAERVV